MGSSGARRIQMALFFIIGVAALVAVFLLANGGSPIGGVRLFSNAQSRQTGGSANSASGGAPGRPTALRRSPRSTATRLTRPTRGSVSPRSP